MFDILNCLLPKRCVFCRKSCGDGLCADCQDRLPWRSPPDANGVVAPLYYRDAVRPALLRYKFRGFSGYAGTLGALIAQAAADSRIKADVVTWAPCGFWRRWTRGYDQSGKLARVVSKRLGLPAEKLLIKKRGVKSQTKMAGDEARRENARGAFKAKYSPRGKRVLLVDDIYTTGATAAACRAALLNAGASEVVCCAVASRG